MSKMSKIFILISMCIVSLNATNLPLNKIKKHNTSLNAVYLPVINKVKKYNVKKLNAGYSKKKQHIIKINIKIIDPNSQVKSEGCVNSCGFDVDPDVIDNF